VLKNMMLAYIALTLFLALILVKSE